MTQRIRQTAVAGAALAGKRLDQAAAALFSDFSRARLQAWIREGALTIDGAAAKPTYRISGGEKLMLDAEPEPAGEVKPQDIPLDILHQDEDIIVINKPAGLVVHPAAGNRDGTLQNALLHFDPSLSLLPRAGLVHRLDKDTTGVMVVARSLRAHSSLVRQLQERRISRVYQALAVGEMVSGGTVKGPIGRNPMDRKRMAVIASGKPAVTHYRVLTRFRGFTHLEVSLETGRTHQIRVHLAERGYPLLGDPLYGKSVQKTRKAGGPIPPELEGPLRSFRRQALHAFRLTLRHPADGEERVFEAPLPDDFRALLEALKRHAGRSP